MIVSIHQPNFLPWLGYFYKIYKADVFVLLDNVQFVKGSICNRNKIKNNMGQSVWITVPVKHSKGLTINFNELEIDYNQKWQHKTLNQITAAYDKAPFFKIYFSHFNELLLKKYDNLADLNIKFIKYFCRELKLKTPLYIASHLNVNFGEKNEINLNITKYFKGDIYLSGSGAKKYNDEELFQKNEIKLVYTDFNHPEYQQLWGDFIPNLSILDLLFNHGPESGLILLKNGS